MRDNYSIQCRNARSSTLSYRLVLCLLLLSSIVYRLQSIVNFSSLRPSPGHGCAYLQPCSWCNDPCKRIHFSFISLTSCLAI